MTGPDWLPEIVEDAELGPDVFWVVDSESDELLGIGLVPSDEKDDSR